MAPSSEQEEKRTALDAEALGQPQATGKDLRLSDPRRIEARHAEVRPGMSPEDVYRARLGLIWAAAHGGASDDPSAAAQEEFIDAMAALMHPGRLSTLPAMAPEQPDVLEGDPDTVDLQVIERVSRIAEPAELITFARETLAATLQRLEQRHEGTRERRVDILTRMTSAVRGSSGAAELAYELFRYLQLQEFGDRDGGFYITIAVLSLTVSSASPADGAIRRQQASFMYHYAVDGIRKVALREGFASLEPSLSSALSSAAGNLALTIASLVPQQTARFESREMAEVLNRLTLIAATNTGGLDIDGARAAPLLRVLGFEAEGADAAEVAAVLVNMGAIAQAWQTTHIGLARLEAASGIVEAATDAPEHPAARLFNAGVSLGRAREGADPDQVRVILESRAVVNLLGLHIALSLSEDPVEALVAQDGLDCIVNFISSYVDYKRNGGQTAVVAGLEPLTQELLNLSAWPPLRETAPRADIGRLVNSAEALGLKPVAQLAYGDLGQRVDDALELLCRETNWPDLLGDEDEWILNAGRLLLQVFETLHEAFGEASRDSTRLPATVADVVARRNALVNDRSGALDTLIDGYAPYASTEEDPAGRGPALAAGAVTEAEWNALAYRLLSPLESIVPALQRFQI